MKATAIPPPGRSTQAALVRQAGAPFELTPVELSPPRSDEVVGGAGLACARETSGVASALQAAIASLCARGTCVVVAVPADLARAQVDLVDLVSRGVRLVSTNQGDANPRTFIPMLIELHRRGRLPVEKLVFSFPFSDINAAEASHRGSAIKSVLHMAQERQFM